MLFQHPRWLFPWKNRLWWQLLAHKYLRLAAPWFLMLTFASNAMLLGATGFRVFFACQLGFYILAAAAPLLPRTKLVAIPAGFVFLNWMTVRAFFHYLTSRDLQRWEVHRLR